MVLCRGGVPVFGLHWHLAVVGVLFAFFSSSAPSAQWDRKGAQEALVKARELREQLAAAPDSSKDSYLRCIETYRLVYLRDPHFSGTDDAIYEAGLVYELMAEKLHAPEYLARAARQYRYLLSDYPQSPYCSDASHRLAQVTAAKPKPEDNSARPTTSRRKELESIRHWSNPDFTRVTIDLDGETTYSATRISDPERVFFDISNAHVSPQWFNKHLIVNDDYLKQIRVAQNRTDVVRVVLDFAGATECNVTELRDPFRIVVELRRGKRAAEPVTAAMAAGARRPEETAAPASTEPDAPADYPKVASTAATVLGPSGAAANSAERAMLGLPVPQRPVLEPVSRLAPPDYGVVTATVATPLPTAPRAPSGAAGPSRPQEQEEPAEVKSAEVRPAPVASHGSGGAARPATPTSSGVRTMTRMLGLKIGRIVIDPGHGGHDTGTIGRGGLREKDLVLEVALRLREMIRDKIGAEVILTRDTDVYVPLEERTAIANARQADLFISIHANSARNRNTSGVETYFLNFARTAEEREIAARENAATEQNIRDLSDLVRKIAQAEKSTESREFAAILQKALHAGMRQVVPSTRDRGVRSAPFVVLIGAHMPSVLAEVAFISNPRDEKLLKKSESRQQLAKSLLSGVEGYMRTLGSDVAQSRADSR